MEKTIIGIFGDRSSAESAINDLRDMGIKESDISYIYSSEEEVITKDKSGTKAGEGAATGATTGAVIGGIAGLVVAAGVLPGLGALFVAGPLATALGLTGGVATTAAGALTGAAAGGLVGALVGLGVTKEEAKIYEERIKLGDVLVSVKTDDPESARKIFDMYDAEEIREYSA